MTGHVKWDTVRHRYESELAAWYRERFVRVRYRVWPYPIARVQSWWLWRCYRKWK